MAVRLSTILKTARFVNYRLFDDMSIDFHPELTVLIGKNGAGKTSLLGGLIPLLTPLIQRIRLQTPDISETNQGSDIKNGRLEFVNTIGIELDVNGIEIGFDPENIDVKESQSTKYAEDKNGQSIKNKVTLNWFASFNSDFESDLDASDNLAFEVLNDVSLKISRLLKANYKFKERSEIELPLIVYYPCMEAQEWLDLPENKGSKIDQKTEYRAYDESLTKRSFNYQRFFSWFKGEENKSRQNLEAKHLETVKYAIYSMLNDDGEEGRFHKLETNYLRFPEEGELEISQAGEYGPIQVSQMSSGQKSLFALVSDLARRLCILNPNKPKPLEGNGIVLIDEIDLHLHPSWQRKVVPQLQKTFPKIQFVVTTHSPFVLQNVPSESIFVLDDGKISDKKYYALGRDIDAVIFEAFGSEKYSTETQEARDLLKLINQCYDLIDDKEYEKAEKIYQKLLKYLPLLDTRMVEFRTALDLANRSA